MPYVHLPVENLDQKQSAKGEIPIKAAWQDIYLLTRLITILPYARVFM